MLSAKRAKRKRLLGLVKRARRADGHDATNGELALADTVIAVVHGAGQDLLNAFSPANHPNHASLGRNDDIGDVDRLER
jgi:hypothetical protein